MPSRTVSLAVDDGEPDRRRFPGIPPGIRAIPTVSVQGVPTGVPPALEPDLRSIPRSGYRPNEERHCDHLRAFPSATGADSLSLRHVCITIRRVFRVFIRLGGEGGGGLQLTIDVAHFSTSFRCSLPLVPSLYSLARESHLVRVTRIHINFWPSIL